MMTDECVSGNMCEEWVMKRPGCGTEPGANQGIALHTETLEISTCVGGTPAWKTP